MVEGLQATGLQAIQSVGGHGSFELAFDLLPPKITRSQRQLLDAAREAMVHTFGWPIGIVLDRDGARPKPTGSAIRTEIIFRRDELEASVDIWELRTNGDFYLIRSLFEDSRGHEDKLFFNTRIVQVTESILYCARLYDRLEVPREARVNLWVRHAGLTGREITAAALTRHVHPGRVSHEDSLEATVEFVLGEVDGNLIELVKVVCAPLLELFDFFGVGDDVYQEIVHSFEAGEVR